MGEVVSRVLFLPPSCPHKVRTNSVLGERLQNAKTAQLSQNSFYLLHNLIDSTNPYLLLYRRTLLVYHTPLPPVLCRGLI